MSNFACSDSALPVFHEPPGMQLDTNQFGPDKTNVLCGFA